eukprot:gene25563-biopygen13528
MPRGPADALLASGEGGGHGTPDLRQPRRREVVVVELLPHRREQPRDDGGVLRVRRDVLRGSNGRGRVPGRASFFKMYRAGRVRDASAAISPPFLHHFSSRGQLNVRGKCGELLRICQSTGHLPGHCGVSAGSEQAPLFARGPRRKLPNG